MIKMITTILFCVSCSTIMKDGTRRFKVSAFNDLSDIESIDTYFRKASKQKLTIQQYKDSLEEHLFDPESSRYKGVKIFYPKLNGKKIAVMCGKHNGKNRYGGYTGYAWFVSNGIISSMGKPKNRKHTEIACLCHNNELPSRCIPTEIYLNGDYIGTGTATANMRPYGTDTVVAKKTGCLDTEITLEKKTAWGSFLFANCLLTGCLGILIDVLTGGYRYLDRINYNISSKCNNKQRRKQ